MQVCLRCWLRTNFITDRLIDYYAIYRVMIILKFALKPTPGDEPISDTA